MTSRYHSNFVHHLWESFQDRMPCYENNKTYTIAAILDPRFKLRWCANEHQKDTSLQLLKDELSKTSPLVTRQKAQL